MIGRMFYRECDGCRAQTSLSQTAQGSLAVARKAGWRRLSRGWRRTFTFDGVHEKEGFRLDKVKGDYCHACATLKAAELSAPPRSEAAAAVQS